MAITHITDHADRGLAHLLQQYKDKPRIVALMNAWLAEIQEVEDALWDVFTERLLQGTPTGDTLIKLGQIVGQGSYGLSDGEFLMLVRARVLTNKSRGKRVDMIAIALALMPTGSTVTAYDAGEATFYIQLNDVPIVDPYIMFDQFLGKAIGAGIRLMFVFSYEPIADTLIWGSTYSGTPTPTPTIDQSPGSSYIAGTTGGVWASAIS